MKRREFIKAITVLCTSMMTPQILWMGVSRARPSPRQLRNLRSVITEEVDYAPPSVMPQVINIFLYGGPSELAGNLTNIEEINLNSQNSYPSYLDPGSSNNVITENHFWGPDSNGSNSAGGDVMEELIASGDMSIYRTINRLKDDNKAHGRSVTQNLVGNLDVYSPGFATTLAGVLSANNPFGKDIDELVLPFVSFEGDSRVFNLGELEIPLTLRPVALDTNFDNPYSRKKNPYLDDTTDAILDSLAREVSGALDKGYQKINDAFLKRGELAGFIERSFNRTSVDENLPYHPGGDTTDPDTDDTGRLVYPDTNFGRRLKAAMSLAISNPDTIFISLGSGGLGGWDDHSEAIDRYTTRMRELMQALRAAVKHMKWVNPPRRNIVINVFGDFGRNVNLNNALGWDHGNNQNLYTIGGWDIPGRVLGKIAGRTVRTGDPKVNRQFTIPADDSYQCEPFAIVSTIYSYFGIRNPEVLTGEPPVDETTPPNERKV